MADDKRRMAADARRVAGKAGSKEADREATQRLRGALSANYERGREAGRAEVASENNGIDARSVVLHLMVDQLTAGQGVLSGIANSQRAISAVREARSILDDALKSGEPTSTDEPKAKGKAKPRAKARA